MFKEKDGGVPFGPTGRVGLWFFQAVEFSLSLCLLKAARQVRRESGEKPSHSLHLFA